MADLSRNETGFDDCWMEQFHEDVRMIDEREVVTLCSALVMLEGFFALMLGMFIDTAPVFVFGAAAYAFGLWLLQRSAR